MFRPSGSAGAETRADVAESRDILASHPRLFKRTAARERRVGNPARRSRGGMTRTERSADPMVSSEPPVPTTIAAENLSKSFSGRPLFSDLSFSASKGLVAVAGRNGSGKTTLLKILAGLLRPTSGRVRFETETGALDSPSGRRLALGWAGPDLQLYGTLTGLENLLFFRRAAGRAGDDRELRARLEAVGLAEAARRRVEEYSTGMKQRLRIAFATLFDPPALLLDEPMAGLDVDGREVVRRAVASARERGPVLLASNDERDFEQPERRIDLPGPGSRT
jgi:heme exporter protein A